MVDQRLITYIQAELKKGYSKDTIRATLAKYGYPQDQIKDAFRLAAPSHKKLFIFTVVFALVLGGTATLFFSLLSSQADVEKEVTVRSVSISESPNFQSPDEEADDVALDVSSRAASAEDSAPSPPAESLLEEEAIKDIVFLAGEERQKARDLCVELTLRDRCLLEAGLTVHDQLFCAVIQDNDKRDTCYFNLALVQQSNLLCRDITDQHLKSTCAQI